MAWRASFMASKKRDTSPIVCGRHAGDINNPETEQRSLWEKVELKSSTRCREAGFWSELMCDRNLSFRLYLCVMKNMLSFYSSGTIFGKLVNCLLTQISDQPITRQQLRWPAEMISMEFRELRGNLRHGCHGHFIRYLVPTVWNFCLLTSTWFRSGQSGLTRSSLVNGFTHGSTSRVLGYPCCVTLTLINANTLLSMRNLN